MNTLAKRIHNIAPDPVHVTFADDSTATFEMQSAEFFQEEFQGVATPLDGDREHRIVAGGSDTDEIVVGRERDDGGFEEVGAIVAVEPAE
ncbi:hypothetical protein MUK72_08610 [Halococcus dombrowskii]|uniref:DUF8072 domain-containing protein n=1 Tax=Halococcus dombrowskii TaxID=179637 RepID=A0AAV3SDV5_HALDO|nr:hypothetical protein [Halococcus dombrowskii]UOO94031.1 hypothetical protein MUK72_08610 [Halococcus dombrowskii]